MVTMDQVKTGLIKYIDADIMPHLSGLRKVGLGVYVALASEKAVDMALQYRDHPAVAVLDVIDDAGNVDIDRLYQAVVPMVQSGEKIPVEIPLIGEIRMDRNDVEKLYRYIVG